MANTVKKLMHAMRETAWGMPDQEIRNRIENIKIIDTNEVRGGSAYAAARHTREDMKEKNHEGTSCNDTCPSHIKTRV